MNVLVYFDSAQQHMAQRTIALLGEKFVFDIDLLIYAANVDLNPWSSIAPGKIRQLHAEGPFEQAVAKACNAKRYDLVVAAPNDRRGLVRIILGSRIGRLVGAAPATIWAPRGEKIALKRIVVGISGGPQSEQDARLAARLALVFNARLDLAFVASQVPLFYTSFTEFHNALESDTTLAKMAPGALEVRRIYLRLKGEGVQVQIVLRSGAVTDQLVSICQGGDKVPPADLLVIGAHAPTAHARTDYLENLTEAIVESAPCPALVVHATSEWAEWEIRQDLA
jgi:nucleotide-binding universal stress UspA family protein